MSHDKNPFVASNEGGGNDIDPVPVGIHPAILTTIYDVGWQYSEKFDKSSKKVIFGFELPSLPKIEITRKDGTKAKLPRGLTIKYTNSLHEKSNMRRDLEGWRGRPYTEEEAKAGVDLTKLIMVGCQVQVMHETTAKGDIRATVRAILPLAKSQWPKTTTEPRLWSISQVKSVQEFETLDLPKWIKAMAAESSEYEKLAKKPGQADERNRDEHGRAPGSDNDGGVPPDDESDVPF